MGYHFTNTGIRVRRHRYTSSQTQGDEFPHKMYGQYTISQTPVYEFTDTGMRVRRHRYTSSKHRYTSSQIPVYEFADTGSASSLAILGDLKVQIEKSNNMGILKKYEF